MKTIFVCDKCGQEFNSQVSAYVHERQCIDGMDMKKAVFMCEEEFNDPYGQVVCKHCDNHYLVYGCELDCEYSNVCRKTNNYKYFNKQDKKLSKYYKDHKEQGVRNGI